MASTSYASGARPPLASARAPTILEGVVTATIQRGGVDIDLIHVMDSADDKLIADEILHGTLSGAFTYSFKISGKTTTGISVVGAKHLARHYGGLKHKMVASIEKRGALHIFRSYPDGDRPMQVTTSVLPELSGEDDYYTAVVEITCIKTGNSFQAEKTESKVDYRQDGTPYNRPNFQTIAQSKAYRNAVLALVPQDVQARFKAECLRMGDNKDMTEGAIDVKRSGIITFATKNSLPITRDAISSLDWDQIAGLSEAARDGGLPNFVNACKALGLLAESGAPEPATIDAKPKVEQKAASTKTEKKSESKTDHDPETGEVNERQSAPAKSAAPKDAPPSDAASLFAAT